MYFNSNGKEEVSYDAIVVGSGITGGFAAMELCERGMKTLVLERGFEVKHLEYPTANLDTWDMPNRGVTPAEEIAQHYPKQSRTNYTVTEARKHLFVKDSEHPYQETKRFDWMRGYHTGGRSLMWGRQTYRWSEMDFGANKKDGHGVDWPIRYADLAPWYSHVENFIGVSGRKEGLKHLPDGEFLPPMDMTCVEEEFRDGVAAKFGGRNVTIGRTAHLTGKLKHNKTPNRGQCQSRNRCMRGCPFGAYFSSQSSSLFVAEASGNMTMRSNSIVHSLIYDKETKRATGVRVIDAETKETHEYFAKIIFVNASTVGSTSVLMQSKSEAMPNGIGATSGELGHNLMDHHFQVGAGGTFDGHQDKYYKGRRPNGIYVPRFRNIDADSTMSNFVRGYGYQGGAWRDGNYRNSGKAGLGGDIKDAMTQPGPWKMKINAFGECLPYHDNKMTLDYDNLDQWGLPTVNFDAEWKTNEWNMREDMKSAAAEMLEAAGFKDVATFEKPDFPGLGIHEMGTARMGRDPKTSVLNANNQVWDAPNVFLTDGAAMTSASCVNPSLTYMALTARAADFAVKALKKGDI